MKDRYARQRLIQGWDQDRLHQARILVVGAGAVGNEVLKNLALLGVGYLLVIDFDRVELSNLSRTVLFDVADVGRAKVDPAAEALAKLNPEGMVEVIDGDVFYDVGLGHYRHSHLVIGCLDNLAARSQVSLCCSLAGIPYLDGGMWAMGGEVRWFLSGDGPCFDCTLRPEDWEYANERRSCSGFRNPYFDETGQTPTVATTAAIIGGLLAQEAVKWLCGYPILAGKALVYNGQLLTLHRADLPRNPLCPSPHSPYQTVIALPTRAAAITARQLLAQAYSDSKRNEVDTSTAPEPDQSDYVLELGRDFLLALQCPACGFYQDVNRLLSQVPESEQICPRCGAVRQTEIIYAVSHESPYADRTLSSLGVPPAEVLSVRTPLGLLFYELTGDLNLDSTKLV